MMDLQLSILVAAWKNRLEREIDVIDGQLPETMP